MRIRTIKPEFFEDERLALLPPHARLLFIACWMMADRNGVMENRPNLIKARVFPYETGEKSDVSRLLPMLFPDRFLVPFDADGKSYLWIPGFDRHQRISGKEAQSEGKFPIPSEEIRILKQQGSAWEAPGKHPGAQEQGTGNKEQGKDTPSISKAMKAKADHAQEFKIWWPKICPLSLNSHEEKSGKIWHEIRKAGVPPEDIYGWYSWLSKEKTGGDPSNLKFVSGFQKIATAATICAWKESGTKTMPYRHADAGEKAQETMRHREALLKKKADEEYDRRQKENPTPVPSIEELKDLAENMFKPMKKEA